MFRALTKDRRAVAAIEFLIILPVLLPLALATFEMAWVIRADMKLTHAADMLARSIALQTANVTSGPSSMLADLCKGSEYMLPPFDPSGYSAAIVSITYPANGNPVQVDWESDNSCASVAPASGSAMLSTVVSDTLLRHPASTVVAVTARYPMQNIIHLMLPATVTLSHMSFARPRINKPIVCDGCTSGS
jgi:hypothetical protein